MKTKKVLALLVLAVMLISIMPISAFGATPLGFNVYASSVIAPTGNVGAQQKLYANSDGNEFTVTVVYDSGAPSASAAPVVYAASSRDSEDVFMYWDDTDNEWYGVKSGLVHDGEDYAGYTGFATLEVGMALKKSSGSSSNVFEFLIKVVSKSAGVSRIAFGNCSDCVPGYATGKSLPANGCTHDSSGHTIYNTIIEGTRFPAEFTAPKAGYVWLAPKDTSTTNKYANDVEYYTLWAYVYTGVNGTPVSGQSVSFNLQTTTGAGARLSATRATTNAAGRAEIYLYSSSPGPITVRASVSGVIEDGTGISHSGNGTDIPENWKVFYFQATGITGLRAVSNDNQKVARDEDNRAKAFRVSIFDANGNRMSIYDLALADVTHPDVTPATGDPNFYFSTNGKTEGGNKDKVDLKTEIVAKPSGAALQDTNVYFRTHNSGDFEIVIPYRYLNKDGVYEVKVYLQNGSSVSYSFDVRDLGEVTDMRLSYGANSYSAGTVMPEPTVYYDDANGYTLSRAYNAASAIGGTSIALSISDASFMDGRMDTKYGTFKLKDDKVGSFTMTLIDRNRNRVATTPITVTAPASYLKLTARNVGAVGSSVTVDIELVDINGVRAVTGLSADAGLSRAAVVGSPTGSVASAGRLFVSDFWLNGTGSFDVSSNMEGDVSVQVIITEQEKVLPGPASEGKTLTGANGTTVATADEKYGGRTYTGPGVVSFGTTSASSSTLIFIIGAPTFVSGSSPFSAQSPAFIENGRTFLGVRDIGTAIGATIDWDPDTETATLAKGNVVVKITVGADAITVTKSGVTTEQPLDAAAINKDGRVYLPFRAVLQEFGYKVEWNEDTQSIVCTI